MPVCGTGAVTLLALHQSACHGRQQDLTPTDLTFHIFPCAMRPPAGPMASPGQQDPPHLPLTENHPPHSPTTLLKLLRITGAASRIDFWAAISCFEIPVFCSPGRFSLTADRVSRVVIGRRRSRQPITTRKRCVTSASVRAKISKQTFVNKSSWGHSCSHDRVWPPQGILRRD